MSDRQARTPILPPGETRRVAGILVCRGLIDQTLTSLPILVCTVLIYGACYPYRDQILGLMNQAPTVCHITFSRCVESYPSGRDLT